jgi:hypothetical protein
MAALCSGVEAIAADQLTCVALDGSPCSPCEERAAILDQIKQLKSKYDAIGTARNAIHDPFVHKLPPEIASHILHLSLPTLNNGIEDPKDIHKQWSIIRKGWAAPLKLGAVCRKWRQLAWATPNLWTTLYIRIKASITPSTAESLPGLLCEWLGRSGAVPLTIYFFPYEDFLEDNTTDYISPWTDALDATADLVIDFLNMHSGQWRNLHLRASSAILERFKCSTEPKQLVSIELADTINKETPPLKFMMESELNLTHLKLVYFPPTSINVRWDNITHATFYQITIDEGLDFLRRAPSLEYYCVYLYGRDDNDEISLNPIVHPRLHSLNLSTPSKEFLDTVNLPSLQEWIQNTRGGHLPLGAMLSFLKRSRCPLKVLNLNADPRRSADFRCLLEILPSLESLRLSFSKAFDSATLMDDILIRIFRSASGSSDTSVDALLESFLPNLQFMECRTGSTHAPFSWDRIPQLYFQGHRRSLTLKCAATNSHISDKTALRLLQIVDEGFDLQIPDATQNGDFLENFRNRMREEIL